MYPLQIQMSGKATKGKGARKAAGGKKSTAAKAGLSMPVGRIASTLRKGRYTKRAGKGAGVVMAAVLEYLVAELLEASANAAKDHGKGRITPRHIQLAIKGDAELSKYAGHATIAAGGVVPNVHPALLKKAKAASQEF